MAAETEEPHVFPNRYHGLDDPIPEFVTIHAGNDGDEADGTEVAVEKFHRVTGRSYTYTSTRFIKSLWRPEDFTIPWPRDRLANEAAALQIVAAKTTIPVPRFIRFGERPDGVAYLEVERLDDGWWPVHDIGNHGCHLPLDAPRPAVEAEIEMTPEEGEDLGLLGRTEMVEHSAVPAWGDGADPPSPGGLMPLTKSYQEHLAREARRRCRACQAIVKKKLAAFIADVVLPQLRAVTADTTGIDGFVMPSAWVMEWVKGGDGAGAEKWAPRARAPDEAPFVLCHGDLEPHNVLCDPETLEIKSLIDWEYAAFLPAECEIFGLDNDQTARIYNDKAMLERQRALIEGGDVYFGPWNSGRFPRQGDRRGRR